MGVSRSAGRVARSRIVSALEARRFASPRLSGSFTVIGLASDSVRQSSCVGSLAGRSGRNQNDLSSPGRKVEPSAVPPLFGDAALRDRRAPRTIGGQRIRRGELPMSDLLDDLGNVAGDLKDTMVDAVTGDYHAAAGAFDYVTGDQAGADAQFADMHASAEAAWGDVAKGGQDLE